jgi:histidyl-tRNA synthetase
MFRYERPQAGRQRQFHQIGLELLGFPGVRSDVEAIAVAWDLLADLGVGGLALELNSLGSAEDRASYRQQLVVWLEARSDQLDADSQGRIHTNPLRVLDSKNPQTQALLADAPSLADALCPESQQRFAKVQQGLKALDIPFVLNPRLVRGLDYYSHTAFEITSSQLGAQATVCGGGRYDGLVQQLGGPEAPAIGWALGMERLALLLAQSGSSEASAASPVVPDLYLVSRGDAAEAMALPVARQCRSVGLAVEIDGSGAAFGKQFKRADRSGARWAVVIGDQEASEGVVVLKDLRAGAAAGESVGGGSGANDLRLPPQELLVRLRPA